MAIVFCGNGINRCEGRTPGWNKLLDDISDEYSVSKSNGLGMTLDYEKFEATIVKHKSDIKVMDIKRKIAKYLDEATKIGKRKKSQKSLYEHFFDIGIKEIITTNYDYAIETVVDPKFVPRKNTDEKIYSLYRKQYAGDIVVYHVHGECGYPQSICLGYEQYAGTLEKDRALLTKSTSIKDEQDRHKYHLYDVLIGIEENDGAWLYKFFTEDIYFVGFGLDVSEIDLWWLLVYRAKLRREKRIPIENKIVFYETEKAKTKSDYLILKEKEDLLSTFDVEVVNCVGRGYRKRYEYAISDIKVRINK